MALDQQALQDLLDKQAISEVVQRYCRGVDRGDIDLIRSVYHPDATDEHGAGAFVGEDIAPGIMGLVAGVSRTMHHLTNQIIELQPPDHAASETYFSVWQLTPRDGGVEFLHALGRYLDRFERRDGEWRILDRKVIPEMMEFTPAPADWRANQPYLGRRDKSDPSYEVLGAQLSPELSS